MKRRELGVLTVEASIVLTLCTFFILFLLSFARIYTAQGVISHAVLQASDAVALESFLRETALNGSEEDVVALANKLTGSTTLSAESFTSLRSANLPAIAKEKFVSALAKTEAEADEKLKNLGIKDGLSGVDFSGTYIDLGDDDVIVDIDYVLEMQFSVFGGNEIALSKSAKSKTFGDVLFGITTVPNDTNKGSVSGSGNYKHGTEIEITAQPNYGYIFTGWDTNGDGVPDTGADLNQKITVTDEKSYVAIFETELLPIRLSVNNSAAGRIAKGNGACAYLDSWEIQAAANTGYSFDGWSGYWFKDDNKNGTYDAGEYRETVTLDKNHSTYTIPSVQGIYVLKAKFVINQYTISVETVGSNASSSVYSESQKTQKTKYKLNYGEKYQLVTSKPSGYTFKGWRVKGTENLLGKDIGTKRVVGDVTYEAVYEISPSIKITGGGTGGNSTKFTAKTVPSDVTVNWKSSDKKVATVNGGTVTAKFTGTATITASFDYNGKTYSASKTVTVKPSIEVAYYCRRDGFCSYNSKECTYGPSWYGKKNTGGMRFYYSYNPGSNPLDPSYGDVAQGVFYGKLSVTWSQIQGARTVGPHQMLTKSMIVHDVATTGPLKGKVNPQVGYNATNQKAYIFYGGSYDALYFIKTKHAPKPGGGYYDYYISKIK